MAVFSYQDLIDRGGMPIAHPFKVVVLERNEARLLPGHLSLVEQIVKPAAPFCLSVNLSGEEVTTK